MKELMVSICCITYNHEEYIAAALDSFLMQKTNFHFEILVHDDASTDKTEDIIKAYGEKYPHIIKPIYQTENQYSKGKKIEMFVFPKANGKYAALCEGDDFWTDPHKLQKQVDYMENHSECSLCVHAAKQIMGDKVVAFIRPSNRNKTFTTAEVIVGDGGLFATNSMFFPTRLLKNLPEFFLNCSVGDYPLTIYLSLNGKVYYIDNVMSAYRIAVKNSWSSKIQANPQKNIEHFKMIGKMLNEVDEYTNYAHCNAVKNRIVKYQFNIMLQQGAFKEIKNEPYKEIYLALNSKSKLKIFLRQYFPSIAQILINIKRNVNQWAMK